jgi:hypothetical protein
MKPARAIKGLLGVLLALVVFAKASDGGDFRRALLQGEWAALLTRTGGITVEIPGF